MYLCLCMRPCIHVCIYVSMSVRYVHPEVMMYVQRCSGIDLGRRCHC